MSRDVVVVGGGNAALCAAIVAREQGARVRVFERAPAHLRGGNTRHTRDIRYAHDGPEYLTTGAYTEDEFLDDLLRVTGGETDRALASLVIHESRSLGAWMNAHGVRWQEPLSGTLHLSRTNAFFLGGGKALLNTYYDAAARLGVEVAHEAAVRDLVFEGDWVRELVVDVAGTMQRVTCDAVVAAAGGFEANHAWMERVWGPAAANFIIRGTPHNDGAFLAALYEHGAMASGDPKGFHAVAVDARAPRFDGGIVTRIDAIPFGICVNAAGERFYDEGEDLWPKRYAIWGTLIASQPDQIAYAIFDAKTQGRFIPTFCPPLQADSIEELARAIGIDATALVRTVRDFNAAVGAGGTFDPNRLDDCATRGITPAKTHWAIPIDAPPYYCYPARPGITFTYRGVRVDERARVLRESGAPFANLFAAGECMAGNILGRGYLGGFGLTIGSVFGRIAGKQAGRDASD